MNKLLFALPLLLSPFLLSAQQIAIQENYLIQGKVFSVKTSKKYASVEGCSKIALSKSKVEGFSFESKTSECTLFKKVRKITEKQGFVSGTK